MAGATISTTLTVLTALATLANSAPEIQFPFGRVQGVDKQADYTAKPYFVYYGIPFAEPPVGVRRFEAPVPYVGSGPNQVISSNSHGPACMQFGYTMSPMSEDCLQLNVYTPPDTEEVLRNARPRKKVMVYIHGGAYVLGGAEENIPSQLVTDYDVMVVVVQYRLSTFGFASTGTSHLPGNYGLRDQILAVKWVKDNIGQFGGDGGDITIFGESAGASSVSLLSLSPATKGLFTKAISQSGTAASYFAVNRQPLAKFELLVKEAGCTPYFPFPSIIPGYYERIIQCLKSKPADAINIAPSFMRETTETFDLTQYVDFSPVVDGDILPYDPLFLLQSKHYLQENGVLDRSYIVGSTNGEGIGLFNGFYLDGGSLDEVTQLDYIKQYIVSTIDTYMPWSTPSQPQIDWVTLEYAYPLTNNKRANIQGMVDLQTDAYFRVPAIQFANAITQASDKTDVFLYLFDHFPRMKDPDSPLQGTDHAIDLLYMWDFSRIFKEYGMANHTLIDRARDEPVFDVYSGAFTSFAKTGDPSRVGQSGQTISWPRYDGENKSYLNIANNPQVKTDLVGKRAALWTQFLPNLYCRQ